MTHKCKYIGILANFIGFFWVNHGQHSQKGQNEVINGQIIEKASAEFQASRHHILLLC